MPFSRDQMWCLSHGAHQEREDRERGQSGDSAAQANTDEPGPNTRALKELHEVQTGKQVCHDIQKAKDSF